MGHDAQTYNYAHWHQPVQPSHYAFPLEPGVKFIYPSRSSSGAEAHNDSFTERSMSAESSRLLASAWLKANSVTYRDFIPDGLGIDNYSKNMIEPAKTEIEHLGMTF
ncbi:hypothetical protein V501_04536 [Pseudogymnoascus sp. VKM F-4519 (FW-2642)]|nr:hypothetical protein V501_04536 [Pseudogymnoascus sp. VKM F-4519 (FW-2642)]